MGRKSMPTKRTAFTPEFKEEAVRMVIESPGRSTAEVAREIHVNEGTLGNWVAKYRAQHAGEEPPLTISERARLRELEKDNRELRMRAEFLGKAAAFFAQEYR
jgi:transposase-like protein